MVNPETERPHPARVYDHLLGGACDFAAARAFAERLVTALSGAPLAARINRAFSAGPCGSRSTWAPTSSSTSAPVSRRWAARTMSPRGRG